MTAQRTRDRVAGNPRGRRLRLVPPPHECDTGVFDRSPCPEPCGLMHSFCTLCGDRQENCLIDPDPTDAAAAPADFEIRWSADEQTYVATAPSHPHLTWSDHDPGEAVTGLLALVVEATAP